MEVFPLWLQYVGVVSLGILVIVGVYSAYTKCTLPANSADDAPFSGDKDFGEVEVFVSRPVWGMQMSPSQFSAKIESFFRLAGVPYKFRGADLTKAPKGKMPYVRHGPNFFGDTAHIARYVVNTFAGPEDTRLGKLLIRPPAGAERDWEAARALMWAVEEKLYFGVTAFRWILSDANWKVLSETFFGSMGPLRFILGPIIRRSVAEANIGQGMGRHSPDDIAYLSNEVIDAVEGFLQDGRPFLCGEHPTIMDCSVFGHLYNLEAAPLEMPMRDHLKDNCPKILAFLQRMQDLLD